jgi:Uma2 family endonuclease
VTAASGISSPQEDLGISVQDLYRLSVEQYHLMGDAGILGEDDPVELLEGWLVCKYGPFRPRSPMLIMPPDTSSLDDDLGLTLADIWRLSVDQYHSMIDNGILTEDDPVELLGGWLTQKTAQKPAHPIAVALLREEFARLLSGPWHVRTQAPITLPEGEPEPDLALVRGDRRDYLQVHPGPHDVLLVAEVADTSLARDRGLKKRLYTQAGIPVYWMVNLIARQIELYTDPVSTGRNSEYRERRDFGPSDKITVILDEVEAGILEVRELLP